MAEQPRGTVSFLFSDIEGSTRLLAALGTERYAGVLDQHRRLLRAAFAAHDGYEVDYEGDSFFVAFASARAAVAAAADAQRALAAASWPDGRVLRVRMGVHTGEARIDPPKYVGLEVHRAARIMAAAHGGQVLLSRVTRDLVDGELPDGLGLRDLGEHGLKDLGGGQRLYQLDVAGLACDHPPPRTLARRATNLPARATPLIGRDLELRELSDLVLGEHVRLLTLTGAGGAGKTRLAIAAATAMLDAFPDGAWFVDLAPLSDADQVVPAIARTLDVREHHDQPLEGTLAAALAVRGLLLVVDNFEHVLDAAPAVARLLEAAPRLHVVVTSRVPLHLTAERRFPVAGLLERDAVALFGRRAGAIALDDAPAVAAICRSLDGVPLAIELAAARSALLSPGGLLARLDRQLTLLTGGPRDAPARQRTLRATIDWSFGLLHPDEQALLAALSVFAGACSLAAVEDVRGGDVLDALAALVEANLVRRVDDSGEPRFSLHEMVRQYALEQLQARGEEDELRLAHARHYATVAERLEADHYTRCDDVPVLRAFDREYANLRAAERWARACGDAMLELRLAAFLTTYRHFKGLSAEGWEVQGHAIAAAERIDRPLGARALTLAGQARIAHESTRQADAWALSQQALAEYRELGDELGVTEEIERSGIIVQALGEADRARSLIEQAVERSRAAGHPRRLANTLNDIAELDRSQGHVDRARTAIDEAVQIARDNRITVLGLYLTSSGELALQVGDLERAHRDLAEAMARSLELGWPEYTCSELAIYAAVAVRRGEPELAATLLGASESRREQTGLLQWSERVYRDEAVERARAELGAAGFDTGFEVGRRLGLEQAAMLVLERQPAVSAP